MELKTKDYKIRDRIIFTFGIIPREIAIGKYIVEITLLEEDVKKAEVNIADMEALVSNMLDRRVKVITV